MDSQISLYFSLLSTKFGAETAFDISASSASHKGLRHGGFYAVSTAFFDFILTRIPRVILNDVREPVCGPRR
jgi:hypothetical protein